MRSKNSAHLKPFRFAINSSPDSLALPPPSLPPTAAVAAALRPAALLIPRARALTPQTTKFTRATAGSPMAQASALAALLRRLRRHRTPAAATLRHHRLVSSAPAPTPAPGSSSLVPLRFPGLLEVDGCGGSGSGLSASLGSYSRPRLPRRHHAVAMATRAAHQAASR